VICSLCNLCTILHSEILYRATEYKTVHKLHKLHNSLSLIAILPYLYRNVYILPSFQHTIEGTNP